MTVLDLLKWANEYLSSCNVPDPYIEAEYLLAHVLGCQRKDLLVYPERILAPDEMGRFKDYIERRVRREPSQYIIGEVEFRGRLFKVNRDVLIPRPETELLVEEAVKSVKAKDVSGNGEGVTIVDLCTGSGCIAISIARELPYCRVYAVDISEGAISVARENAERHGVDDRVIFLSGDLFDAIEPLGLESEIDLIISNPPYVSTKEMEGLQPEIKEYEPLQALYGGEDGLDFYRRIIHEAPFYLTHGGLLIMEIGYGQGERIKGLFEQEGVFEEIEVKKDFAGIERVIKTTYSPQ
ncbi:MAG: peptide chain release factor N(5)-glutamine methyltransferase [Nitrospirae bacterium]|nr:peptide chain release factor N(5)-glutamine methyltransferase [Nitrospirota bacterium]